MSDFDDFDDDLASALRSRAVGASHSAATAHGAVLHRATTIRRRRAAMAGSGLAAVAVIGVFLLPRAGDQQIGTADSTSFESTSTSVDDATVSSSTDPSVVSVAPTVVDVTVPDVSATATSSTGAPGVSSTIATVPRPSTTPSPSTAATTTTTSAPTTSTAPASTSASTTIATTTIPATSTTVDDGDDGDAVAPFTNSYSSTGGSITVTWNGSSLTLDAASPTAGHDAEIEDAGGTRVRVRFRGPSESRIEVRVEDGDVRVDIDE